MILFLVLAVGTAGLVHARSIEPANDPPSALADTVAAHYARKEPAALERLLNETRSISDELLVRYRLYPLTRDSRYLDGLPEPEACRSARDVALLSALWAYRLAEAPVWRLAVYGRRSDNLLRRAVSLDPDDPFVLLVEGQSLLYRPAMFGGDADAALDRFVRLRDDLRRREMAGEPVAGLPVIEAEVWVWYTLHRLNRTGTDALRDSLLARNPPLLYREFLQSPP